MNEDQKNERKGTRKPYQAPRVLVREPLEAVATVCSPAPPAKADAGSCPMGPVSS
ncbi:MAG: hypothetical protein KC416_04690 [Myxococcales bacterium]|nr:hypothetical protein [Myxococcales bacterium]